MQPLMDFVSIFMLAVASEGHGTGGCSVVSWSALLPHLTPKLLYEDLESLNFDCVGVSSAMRYAVSRSLPSRVGGFVGGLQFRLSSTPPLSRHFHSLHKFGT